MLLQKTLSECDKMVSREFYALRPVPECDLENRIKYLRRCVVKCPMIETLDERMERQRELVIRLLDERGIEVGEFEKMHVDDIDDPELVLFWHILRDTDYINNLR